MAEKLTFSKMNFSVVIQLFVQNVVLKQIYGDERDAMDAWNKRVEHRDTKQQERKAYE